MSRSTMSRSSSQATSAASGPRSRSSAGAGGAARDRRRRAAGASAIRLLTRSPSRDRGRRPAGRRAPTRCSRQARDDRDEVGDQGVGVGEAVEAGHAAIVARRPERPGRVRQSPGPLRAGHRQRPTRPACVSPLPLDGIGMAPRGHCRPGVRVEAWAIAPGGPPDPRHPAHRRCLRPPRTARQAARVRRRGPGAADGAHRGRGDRAIAGAWLRPRSPPAATGSSCGPGPARLPGRFAACPPGPRSRRSPRSVAVAGRSGAPGTPRRGHRGGGSPSINGRSVKSLYGVSYVYGATGLFKSAITPATLEAACGGRQPPDGRRSTTATLKAHPDRRHGREGRTAR